ncbi:thiol:disulfide interchange protein [Mycobacterium gordonae]|nr:redoxin domain-containing protein [Mycobacterium gordonae]OBJ87420.1 thiol:disulfide interchange protein [Mycobacterium gordonae]
MTHSRLVALLAIAATLVVGCGSRSMSEPSASHRYPPGAADTQPPTARTVPMQLRFIAKTLDGKDFHGQDLVGKPAVLWFWAPWCPTCQREAPVLGQVATSHPSVTFVGVAGLDEVTAMREFVERYPSKGLTQLADTDGSVWAKFGVTQQPAFAFIRPDGSIDVVKGPLSEPELVRWVAALSNDQ